MAHAAQSGSSGSGVPSGTPIADKFTSSGQGQNSVAGAYAGGATEDGLTGQSRSFTAALLPDQVKTPVTRTSADKQATLTAPVPASDRSPRTCPLAALPPLRALTTATATATTTVPRASSRLALPPVPFRARTRADLFAAMP